ncbi:MAG: SDR family oxidoreductase, partial [Alphaproteobacteria bacterium]|nr:SDR family oxidoreductase [Alphaproteobacteria bacterium]
ERAGGSADELYQQRCQQNPSKRVGTAEEFGEACAFLCSDQAGFIVGQNLLLDGGEFNSTM